MSATLQTYQFPSAIKAKLQWIRWHHAAISLAYAFLFASAAWLAMMLTSMALDWMYPFASTWLRLVMTSMTVTASLGLACWLSIRPVRHALEWGRAASAVDQNIPELEERWATVASLSSRDAEKLSSLERSMAAQVTSEAIAMERIVQPRCIESSVSLRPAVLSAAVAIGVLALCFALAPEQMSILLRRFLSPTSTLAATQLASLTGDKLVPRGESVDLEIEMRGLQRATATLTLKDENGHEQEYRLRPTESALDQFTHSLRLNETMTYRVRAGDAQTPWHRLQAIDYPELDEVRLTIEFPQYTDREKVERDRFPSEIKAIQGSVLRVAFKSIEPLKRCALSLSNPNEAPSNTDSDGSSDKSSGDLNEQVLTPDENNWYHFEMPLVEDVLLRPMLVSQHGLENRRRQFTRIDVIADSAPVARVIKPTDEVAVAEDSTIQIEFEAHDDHGIATAELVVFDESQRDEQGNAKVLATQKIELGDQSMRRHVMGKTQLDLKPLGLSEGQQVSYAVRVTDNRDARMSDESDATAEINANSNSKDAKDLDRDLSEQMLRSTAENEDSNEVPTETKPKASSQGAEKQLDGDQVAEQGDQMAVQDDQVVVQGDQAKSALQEDAMDVATHRDLSNIDKPNASENTQTSDAMASDEAAQPDAAVPGSPNAAVDSDAPKSPDAPAVPNALASSDGTESPDASVKPLPPVDEIASIKKQEASNLSNDQDKSTMAAGSTDSVNSTPASEKSNATQQSVGQGNSQRPGMVAKSSQNSAFPSQSTVSAKPNKAMPRNSNSDGQNTFTDRRRLKITATLSAITKDNDPLLVEQPSVRESVVEIDRRLAVVESELLKLVDHAIADADRGEQWKRLDLNLADVETFVAELRQQTKENEFAFVGLQMVDITRTHVTPARDRVFAGSQRPAASDGDAKMALQHILRARELLAALLKRYDQVEQETKLQKAMGEAVTMYEVYVKKRSVLMREARQNLNPLDRKMGIIEVDQAYLDRLAEVLRLRAEMMEEFAQMLGDDPRLLSRFMELSKRRQASLRDQLTEISQRQFDMTEEVQNWLQIEDAQRPDLWSVMIDLRLAIADDLAKDAAELSERIEKQMPLDVELTVGTPVETIAQAKQIATTARTIRMDADDVAAEYGKAKDANQLQVNSQSLAFQCERLFSLLDQLQVENTANDGFNLYVESRIQEARAVADQANLWASLSSSIATSSYHRLVESEQHRLAVSTQLLRVSMLDMETDLEAQFRRLLDTDLPGDITDMLRTLHRLMESITFNQLAASFRSGQDHLEATAKQQQLATDRLAEAESLFDKIRRTVVERLDENDPIDPNIADLIDPTLDDFLAQLEREPSVTAQLGIPNRQTNLRIQADAMMWQPSTQGILGMSANAATQRVRQAMKMPPSESNLNGKQEPKEKQESQAMSKADEQQLSAAEKQQREEAKRAQEQLVKTLAEIKKQQDNQSLPASQRERLKQMAKELQKLLEPREGSESAEQVWQRMVQVDEAEELMRAVAAGEEIPDDQWNRLMSTLDDGLWQTRGNRPPEAYRKAIEQYQDQIRELMPTVDES